MKKLKFFPSLLMLVLCVAVLCVGVFAMVPSNNQLTGKLKVVAANPEVLISAYKVVDGVEQEIVAKQQVRKGIEIPI